VRTLLEYEVSIVKKVVSIFRFLRGLCGENLMGRSKQHV
jgi:hypothetical protein